MLIYLLMAAVLFFRPAGPVPGRARLMRRRAAARARARRRPAGRSRLVPVGRPRSLSQPFYLDLFRRIMIFAIAAVSLDLILGYGGMVSFGHAAYLGIGAYAVGHPGLLRHPQRLRAVDAGRGALGAGRRW